MQKFSDPAFVRFSLQVYRALLRAYPRSFQQEYGGLMIQAFRDSCLRAHRQNSLADWALWGGRIFADTFLSVMEQYANRGVNMSKSSWVKISGWFMAASSIVVVAGWLASSRPIYNEYNALSWPVDRYLNLVAFPILVMGMLLIGCGLVGLKVYFARKAGAVGQMGLNFGLVGTLAAAMGTMGLGIIDSSPWWEMFMLGITVLFIGLLIFGADCLRRKLFSRWNALPLLTSILWPVVIAIDLLYPALFESDLGLPGIVNAVIVVAAFGGIGLMGYMLQAEAGKTSTEPA